MQMGFFTALPGNNPEDDDMLLYADDVTAEGNDAVTDLTTNKTLECSVILIDTDSNESANLTNETQVISSPSILSGDSSRVGEPTKKRMYRCRKCGKSKKGHACPMDSNTSSEDSVTMDEPREGSRRASNKLNLTRLAQRVDGDDSSDPDWVTSRRIDGSSMRTSPRLVTRKRAISTNIAEIDENIPPKKARKLYECRYCHVPLKGHKCPHKLINRQIRQLSETAKIILDRVDQE
ncbi:uncharacterized protein LOC130700782 [Daphnia carinata]|uniref:uncharacterized protein LOC130700782 n=1 Tax=Daphnia carinata TaxID=120202 RepID=UPI0028684463|nr:uncharacterized protein LOC130700782 [Daphnia carinata]